MRGLTFSHALDDVSFAVRRGEVVGVAALEGQGQEELFDCIAGARRADAGEVRADGRLLRLRHPADAIRAGLVLMPANRLQALLPQRSIRENVALSAFGRASSWGPIAMTTEKTRVDGAVARLQIDTRAASEVRRLSGGNQQKVVIARWLAAGFRTLLCFDPTRGIDIGTKRQIYALVREIAGQGASVLLFTSELQEIRLACDRAIVLFGGRISGEMAAKDADEASLLRAAHGLASAEPVEPDMTAAAASSPSVQSRTFGKIIRFLGMPLLLAASLAATVAIHPDFGAFEIQSLALGALPLALAAAAQTVVVISGGIDLSIGSQIAVANVLSASLMQHATLKESLALSLLVLVCGAAAGFVNGVIVALSRIPDVVATLTTGFIWGGIALLILERPGGGAPPAYLNIAAGADFWLWLPNALIVMIGAIAAIWLPINLSRLGLLLYAAGSDPVAAFRSGVDIRRARTIAYVFSGIACAVAGMGLTMTTGIGAPLAGSYYTLSSVAAVVIGGVSLSGGRGGMTGPVIAALLLTLAPMDLVFLGIDPNYGQVIQGTLIVLVVMVGGLFTFLQARK